MTTPDHGVDLLLRRAADELTVPDVDRLVAGGLTRGRTRRRRARIGTAVATAAVIGVVGAGAAVVPRLAGDPDAARDPQRVRPATSAPTRSGEVAPPAVALRPLVAPEAMSATLQRIAGATQVEPVPVEASDDRARLYYATVDHAQVSFRIRWYNSPTVVADGGRPLAPSFVCEPGQDVDCTTLPDGSRLLREEVRSSGGAGVPDTFQERSLTLATADGWQIDVIARNTTDEKQGRVVAAEPVLTMAEMEALATSPEWYR